MGVLRHDGQPPAIVRFVHVYIDQQTRRPVDVPPEIRKALAQLA
jgi:acyl-CoA thioester hydrolase